MKRSEQIAPLSRDHHTGLLFCWKIRQGLRLDIPVSRIIPYIGYYYQQHLQPHFREEELLLFRLLPDDELCKEAVHQHVTLREKLDYIVSSTSTGQEVLVQLADTLDAHIRFEERQLFPHLESILTREQLEMIGSQLALSHQSHRPDNYPDEFWTRKAY